MRRVARVAPPLPSAGGPGSVVDPSAALVTCGRRRCRRYAGMRKHRVAAGLLAVGLGLLAGSLHGGWPFAFGKSSAPAAISHEVPAAASPVALGSPAEQVEAARRYVEALDARLQDLEPRLLAFADLTGAKRHGAFTSAETDHIEGLFYQYLNAREALCQTMVHYARGEELFQDEQPQAKSLLISWYATVLEAAVTAAFVDAYVDDRALSAKLNEEYFRSGIPARTFDALLATVRKPGSNAARRATREHLQQDQQGPSSHLADLLANAPEWGAVQTRSDALCTLAEQRVESVLRRQSPLLPDVANVMLNNPLTEHAREAGRGISESLYEAQSMLFTGVGDAKQPATPPADFNPHQVAQIKSLLQPGDILLTYSAGYMSNLFLPGRFKHGILYIGLPEARARLGLRPDAAATLPAPRQAAVAACLAMEQLPNGYDADLIEAVSEGVIFNSIDRILKFHVNRLVALRPRVSQPERVSALLRAFALTGSRYDFKFDFADVSEQCCTEVLYRAYNASGGIHFDLVPRLGVLTLSADDIVAYVLGEPGRDRFDVLLVAEDDPAAQDGRGRVVSGEAAPARLREIMADQRLKLPEFRLSLPNLGPFP
jgi:hypothetical protein